MPDEYIPEGFEEFATFVSKQEQELDQNRKESQRGGHPRRFGRFSGHSRGGGTVTAKKDKDGDVGMTLNAMKGSLTS